MSYAVCFGCNKYVKISGDGFYSLPDELDCSEHKKQQYEYTFKSAIPDKVLKEEKA